MVLAVRVAGLGKRENVSLFLSWCLDAPVECLAMGKGDVLVLLRVTGLNACVGLGMYQPLGTALVERHPVIMYLFIKWCL